MKALGEGCGKKRGVWWFGGQVELGVFLVAVNLDVVLTENMT